METKFIAILIVFPFIFQISYAEALSITTEKETYHYGDYLTFTITVDEVDGSLATLYVIDENGKRSSPIPMPLSELVTTQTARDPFGKETYPEGKWTLRIEYGGDSDVSEFFLKDSGELVLPIWFVNSGKLWAANQINENIYAADIRKLIKEDFITIPNFDGQSKPGNISIPMWLKTTNGWWITGLISDQEYANSIEFLINKGIIIL